MQQWLNQEGIFGGVTEILQAGEPQVPSPIKNSYQTLSIPQAPPGKSLDLKTLGMEETDFFFPPSFDFRENTTKSKWNSSCSSLRFTWLIAAYFTQTLLQEAEILSGFGEANSKFGFPPYLAKGGHSTPWHCPACSYQWQWHISVLFLSRRGREIL